MEENGIEDGESPCLPSSIFCVFPYRGSHCPLICYPVSQYWNGTDGVKSFDGNTKGRCCVRISDCRARRIVSSEDNAPPPGGGVFRVREYLRSRLSDYLRISDPDLYERLECKGRSVTSR
jgi:hypothetical protein